MNSWKEATGWLYKSVLISALAGIIGAVAAVFSVFNTVSNAAGAAAKGHGGDALQAVSDGANTLDTITLITGIVSIACTVIFLVYITKLIDLVNAADKDAVSKIRLANVIAIVGSIFVAFVPSLGIVAFIINVVAWVILFMAYGSLKNSSTFPAEAAKGMGRLRTAMILSIIGALVALIPFIGFIGGLVSLFAFIWNILGWKRVANSDAPAC